MPVCCACVISRGFIGFVARPSRQVRIRTNFGFLYSFVGRTAFLLFVASICLCAQTASGYFMFAVTFINASVNCLVLATHPAFKKGGQLSPFDDPTKVR